MAEAAQPAPRASRDASAGAPLLEVIDLHVRYGPIRALKGVSLAVAAGEVVAILGATAPASPR
jgi:ABC-type histidine transport system ATPase subunit